MPDKPATVAAYAAGASLAAITLFYVFGPNFTIDGDDSSDNNRKKGIVGLSNPANDCFINSVLQALAGLGDLRLYLIRELHRRELDGQEVYDMLPDPQDIPRDQRPERLRELQQGTVTKALKEMLDRLNERPIYKKTISARPFVQALEYAFRTRISRNQQDAQEFLQIVAERLSDEYHAGIKARQRMPTLVDPSFDPDASTQPAQDPDDAMNQKEASEVEVRIDDRSENGLPAILTTKLKETDNEYGFPFEGQLESQIECQFCHYQYKPNKTSFVNLTLQVPQASSTTLNACFDGLLKTEYIDDFRCDKCRLQHALEIKLSEKARAHTEEERQRMEKEIQLIKDALENDPEQSPDGVTMPPSDLAPKRRIARHMRIVVFPKIIAIHLSRSIFDHSSSTKNAAKVAFPERLPLGGILTRKWYKLLAIVCHKGSHQSGHYESFRRNNLYPPFSTPDVFRSFAQSRVASENPSRAPSPRIRAKSSADQEPGSLNISPAESSPSLSSLTPPSPATSLPVPQSQENSRPTSSPRVSFQSNRSKSSSKLVPSSTPEGRDSSRSPSIRLRNSKSSASLSSGNGGPRPSTDALSGATSRFRRKRKHVDRWWRISDEKVKECKTADVLGMQREVYLLFYEIEKPDTSPHRADDG
ncbi:ubiquitin-specific protease [Paecilomyces lecythidis]